MPWAIVYLIQMKDVNQHPNELVLNMCFVFYQSSLPIANFQTVEWDTQYSLRINQTLEFNNNNKKRRFVQILSPNHKWK